MKQETLLRLGIVAAAVGAPAAAAVLYFADPTENASYPRCTLFALTGIHCPFCGATRCGHALLNGDLLQALAWNPIAVVVLPLGTLWLFWAAWRVVRRRPLPSANPPTWSIRWITVGLLVFWLLRNLPFYPFELLAPHKL
jgi:hypothetical protein